MRIWKLALSAALVAGWALSSGNASAYTDNSQGAAHAPVSVNAATKVIPCSPGRTQWLVCPETVTVRCRVGPAWPACGAPNPAPTANVGFRVAVGACWDGETPNSTSANPSSLPALSGEVDCASTGAATNVDTWEFP